MSLLIFLICSSFGITQAQEKNNDSEKRPKKIWVGLNYGAANLSYIPNRSYSYKNTYFKAQVNYLLKERRTYNFELNIEPSIYFARHQLLNFYFITPDSGPDFQERRDRFTQKRSFNEYALNFGLIFRYKIVRNFSSYAIASVGPMISGADTERLKKGFAFSDILGLGFSYRQKRIRFDLRVTLRHNSNLDFSKPNHGHNSAGIESGVSFKL